MFIYIVTRCNCSNTKNKRPRYSLVSSISENLSEEEADLKSMSVTVFDLMREQSRPPRFVDNELTVTTKPWTRVYYDFLESDVTPWPPTLDAIETFLGPGNDVPSSADSIGLQTPAYMLNTFEHELESEADVTMDFNHLMVPCLAKAFSGASALTRYGRHADPLPGAPLLWPRSQVGPTGSINSPVMVDYQMTMLHTGRELELAAMIGEMKRPRTIRGREWGSRGPVSSATTKLQKELRGYIKPDALIFRLMHIVLTV